MDFKNNPIQWQNSGALIPEEIRDTGFYAGYKPPADYFNYKWYLDYMLVKELQEKLSSTDTKADGKAPIYHAVNKTTYGVGSSVNYGHVKLSDSTTSTDSVGSGIAATPSAVMNAISKARSEATEMVFDESSARSNDMVEVRNLITTEEASRKTADTELANNKAPNNHASTTNTYGVGTGTYYGHLKLSNTPSTSYGTSSGYASTPYAVQIALNQANSYTNNAVASETANRETALSTEITDRKSADTALNNKITTMDNKLFKRCTNINTQFTSGIYHGVYDLNTLQSGSGNWVILRVFVFNDLTNDRCVLQILNQDISGVWTEYHRFINIDNVNNPTYGDWQRIAKYSEIENLQAQINELKSKIN